MSKTLIRESIIEDHILLIEIDHPPVNVLSKQVRSELHDVFENLKYKPQIRVALLIGSNRIFCCGDDLKEAHQNLQSGVETVKNALREFGELMLKIEACEVPVISLIDGWCIGGGLELSLCTDIRLASRSAKFRGAGVSIGLMASTYRLPQLIGISKAKELLLTGKQINADEAYQIGLINYICDSTELVAEGVKLAKTIAIKAPRSVKATKRSINNSHGMSRAENDRINGEMLYSLAETEDYRKAVQAHIHKTKPVFDGR